ncbi:reverse transcriptase domain-containing protein [Tanacetum coccineum]
MAIDRILMAQDTFYNALNANDQDSLNSAAGGNFLDKMPRECLRIIESKSKVRNSRNKAVVAKVSSNSSTPGISPDVAALTTEVSELKNMMKTMLIDKQKAQAPAPVKAVEQSCVTCGGAHSYKNCPATDGNVYRDNIQEYVSQAAAANFNQGNTNSRPPMVSNQIRPPGFPPIQNNQNRFNQNQGNNFNQNRGTNFNQNRGNNFYQGQVYQPPTNQTPVHQAPAPQMQGVSKTDFENYVKANDAVLRNMQNQGQGLQNQMTNLTKMLSKFISSNTASSSSSGTLPSQTVTNPREHVNVITIRSGKTCEGPSTPLVPTSIVSTPLKEPEQNPETSIDKPNSLEPNSYQPKLPYPERMKVREKDVPSAQQSRFTKLFKQLRLEIGLKDALIEMPKFNKWLSTLLRNKENLEEIAVTTVNAKCSAIILNKVPEKLEDPGKFLIPCALQELDRNNALADSGASINLFPHSIYKQLGLGALKPTRMTLELANRSVTHPMGIAEDVVVRVDGFTFLVDFVVVNFEPDPRVPIILGRPFLCTAKALIDLYEEKLTLRKDEQFSGSTTIHSDALLPSSSPVKTSDNLLEEFADEFTLLNPFPSGNDDSILKKDVQEEIFQIYLNSLFEFEDNFNSINKNPLFNEMEEDIENENSKVFDEPVLPHIPFPDKVECFNPGGDNDEIDAFLAIEVPIHIEGYFDSEGDVTYLESLLSDDTTHNLSPKEIFNHEPQQLRNEPENEPLITFSPKSDPLHHEFTGELIMIPLGIVREHEDYINRMSLLYNDSIPLGVKSDFDSEEDIIDNLLNNDSTHECLTFNIEPDTPVINHVDELNEDECFDPWGGEIDVEVDNSFTYVTWIFLPYLTYLEVSPLLSFTKNEDTIFDPDIST